MHPRYLKIVLKWSWLLILIPILTSASALAYNSTQPSIYRAITRLIIGPGIESPNPDLNSLRAGALLMQTYSELVGTETFREKVINDLGLDMTTAKLREIVDLRPIVDTQVLNVVVDFTDSEIVVAIANKVADEMVNLSPSLEYNDFLLSRIQEQANRIEADIVNTESRLADLQLELEDESDPARQSVLAQRIADDETKLTDANATLVTLYNTLQSPFTNQVEVVDRAQVAVKQSSELALTLVIAGSTGIIISLMLFVVLIFLDGLFVNTDMLKHNRSYQLWGAVKLGSKEQDKNIRMLTAFMLHQIGEDHLDSIMLTGVESSSHVAIIASELAITLSQTGMNVLLIDADFSNDVVARRFGLGNSVGLIDLTQDIHEDRTLTNDEMTHLIASHNDYPNLRILPSGKDTTDAFFLIASQRMAHVLQSLRGTVDYTIVTAPALPAFEESVAMATWTSGSLIVVRQGKTRLADLNRAIDYLETAGGQVRGLIVSE